VPRSTTASKSSAVFRLFETIVALCAASGIAALSLWYFLQNGWLRWYGDAQAHLSIARRLFDTRTPDYRQIGGYWLPMLHWATAPFARNDEWWRSGLAGGIPSAVAFVVASVFLFLAVRRLLESSAAAFAALAVFASNPNVLYLSSTSMTEPYFFAALFALLYFTAVARQKCELWAAALAGLFGTAGALSRYDGWFVLPFAALYLLTAPRRRFQLATVFCLIAGIGPLYWMAHHWWMYGDPIEFYAGEYSHKAIYARQRAAGMERAPGDHDWSEAITYFLSAARVTAGGTLPWVGLVGIVAALVRRAFWPVLLLMLPPIFYVLSMYGGGSPIYMPHVYPFSYYNTRYGLAALPLMVLGAAALAAIAPRRWRLPVAVATPILCAAPWLSSPKPEAWICWKESQVNSEGRRAWTRQAADFLRTNYRGGGIIHSFGDQTAIFPLAGIPLRDTLHQGDDPQWYAAVQRPDLFLWEEWAVAFSGDRVATAILRAQKTGPRYECVKMIVVKGEQVIEIYRRAPRFRP
jgi:hypothetical protein